MEIFNPEASFEKDGFGVTTMNLKFERFCKIRKLTEIIEIPRILLSGFNFSNSKMVVKGGSNPEESLLSSWSFDNVIQFPILKNEHNVVCTVKTKPQEMTISEIEQKLGHPIKIKREE